MKTISAADAIHHLRRSGNRLGGGIFDLHSGPYARGIDESIRAGAYERGQLFVDAIQAGAAPGGRILDYGCGPGRMTHILAARGYIVDGVDPAPSMIAEAQAADYDHEKTSFRVADDNGASLPTGQYAGIVCSSVIEFVSDPDGLLRNFVRTLKPGGLLAISFSNRRSLWRAYVKFRFQHRHPHYALQYNSWTFAEAKAIIQRAGFEVVSGPVYYDVASLVKRPRLKFLAKSSFIGTLAMVTARANLVS